MADFHILSWANIGIACLLFCLWFRSYYYVYYLSPLRHFPTLPLPWYMCLIGHSGIWNRNIEGKLVRDLLEEFEHDGFVRVMGE